MADVVIEPGKLSGTVCAPPSKSVAHRALLMASMARGKSVLGPVALSEDIEATLSAARALGAQCSLRGESLTVIGGLRPPCLPLIDCRESGSTLRFLLPITLAAGSGARFVGRGRLGQRPMTPYEDICREQGIRYIRGGGAALDLQVEGRLRAGRFTLPGNVSSQFVSGLLMALPLLEGDSQIVLTGPVESSAYIDLTLDALSAFGVRARRLSDRHIEVAGGQHYLARNFEVEGDYSQAAVFLCAGALGAKVSVAGLTPLSRQSDRAVCDHLMRLGARIDFQAGVLSARADRLVGAVIDASQCPDIVPLLALVCALAEGESRIVGAARLRLKESDRLRATREELNRLGARVEETPDGLIIQGVKCLAGGVACGAHGDHRIAMLLAVAALSCKAPITLGGVECLRKSYPNFLEDFQALGGIAHG